MSTSAIKQARAKTFSKYREYYEVNKYLGGLITTTYVTQKDKLEDVVVVRVPKGTEVIIEEFDLATSPNQNQQLEKPVGGSDDV